jgi:hypothetical protein
VSGIQSLSKALNVIEIQRKDCKLLGDLKFLHRFKFRLLSSGYDVCNFVGGYASLG